MIFLPTGAASVLPQALAELSASINGHTRFLAGLVVLGPACSVALAGPECLPSTLGLEDAALLMELLGVAADRIASRDAAGAEDLTILAESCRDAAQSLLLSCD